MAVVVNKCPNCGAEVNFDPQLQMGKCDFCMSTFSIDEMNDSNRGDKRSHSEKGTDSYNDGDGTVMYSCPRCGAEVITDKTTSATFCCYCHSAVVLSDRLAGNFKPEKIIPFKLDKNAAIEVFKKWCKGKKFLPKDFCSAQQAEKITGIYIPYWLFDCDTKGEMNARAEKVNTWSSGDYRYTKREIYSIYRKANMKFSGVPTNASRKFDDKLMESIEPFDYAQMRGFNHSYLPGFFAEKYDRNKETVYSEIEAKVKSAIKGVMYNSIKGYTTFNETNSNYNITNKRYTYALLPVWLMTYSYNKKTYIFAVNGQTGKSFGTLPVSRKKIAILFIVIFLFLFLITI